MSVSLPTYDEQRLQEELDLAARAATVTAARSHRGLARLYRQRIADTTMPERTRPTAA